MAGSVNKCLLVGNLCADPEVRSFASGGKVANLRLATNETWKDRDGNKQERVEYHSVAVFGDGLAGVAERYLRKGSKIYVEGQLRTRKWQTQAGEDRYTTEVVLQGPGASLVMLGDPQSGSRTSSGSRSNDDDDGWRGGGSRGSGDSWGSGFDDLNDDVGF